jgi:glycosyltransferase involved in cell wall biosynthesis
MQIPSKLIKNNDMQIDILLPVYNGESYLADQLDSIINQTNKNWRLLVRDDGSTDNSSKILHQYARKYPKKIVFIQDDIGNVGTKECLNILSAHVDAEIFSFCDQDDVWHPEKISISLNALNKINQNNMPLLVYCDMAVTDKNLNITNKSFWAMHKLTDYALSLKGLPIINSIAGCTMLGNRDLLEAAFPIPYCAPMHDIWVAFVAKNSGQAMAIDSQLIYYRQHESNQLGAGSKIILPLRLIHVLKNINAYFQRGEVLRNQRVGMIQELLKRKISSLRYRDCIDMLESERGGMLKKIIYLIRNRISLLRTFIYWIT